MTAQPTELPEQRQKGGGRASFTVERRLVSAEEHATLAAAVGWQEHFDPHVRAAAIAASLAGAVCVTPDGKVVGMARAVGDGLQYAYVQDVIVHPEFAGNGVATLLVRELLEQLRPVHGAEMFIGLFASPEAETLYEELGFRREGSVGMHRVLASGAVAP